MNGGRVLIAAFAFFCCGDAFGVRPLPERPTIAPDECPLALPLAAHEPPPEDLVDPATWLVTCAAVAVPSSQVAHLLALQAWAEAVAATQDTPAPQPSLLDRGAVVIGAAALGFAAAAVLLD